MIPTDLITPCGGDLIDLKVSEEAIADLVAHANQLQSIQLSERSVCDLEMLVSGAFSPLDRFMGREDHERVLEEMRLTSGSLFPIPVTLPVDAEPAHLDREVALRDEHNELLAVMTIEEIYQWDLARVSTASSVQRTCDTQ